MFFRSAKCRNWPLTAAPVGDARGSYRGYSGHPTLIAPRQFMTLSGLTGPKTLTCAMVKR
jgi:hypothetical protein